MLEELNRRLAGLRERVAYRRKLEASLEVTRQSLAYHTARLPALAEAMHRESRDVERLEGNGPRAIVASVLGQKSDRLERERREYLAASLQHHECTHAIARCEGDLADLAASLEMLGDVDALYLAAIDEKERVLAGGADARALRLARIAEEIGALTFQAQQAAEAIEAGQEGLARLDDVATAIDVVVGDRWLSVRTMLVTAPRPVVSLVGDIAEAASEAQDALRDFRRELADVGMKAKLKLDLEILTHDSRSFFGGLYSDQSIRAQAASARGELESVREKVESLVGDVEALAETLEQRLGGLRAERVRLVEEA